MKLQTQLTLAFTTLLIIIMSVVGILIHSLLLQVLVRYEKEQLQEKSEILVQLLLNEGTPQNFTQWLSDEDLHLFVYDRNQQQAVIRSSAIPADLITYWANKYDLSETDQSIWTAGDHSFVVNILPIFPELIDRELVLITPLDEMRVVQRHFLDRMMIIFLIGIIVVTILTHYLTHRLVTPLTKLKYQLKKIEKRQFDDIERVKATGEIKEVEESVIDMVNELQKFIQSQQQFFQNASHELKTPLMTIQGYAEGIRDGIFVGEESDRGLDIMVAEIGRLKKIINEMILLAKLDSDEKVYQKTTFKVSELIESVVDRALPLANERGVIIEHHVTDGMIEVDQEKMLQAMMNIVTNAIRHTHSKVCLYVERRDQQIEIRVEDDGEGIDDELMPRLFQRFIKGKGGETGLGLAISRAIVERSGGKIVVDHSELGGACFKVTL